MSRIFREKFKTFGDVFDQFTIRNLFVLSSKDYFEEESLSPISVGKEANVFQAKRGEQKVAVKIYRLETADFNRMYQYICPDPRFPHVKKRRREIIFAWARREYRNLLAARKALVQAPLPIAFKDNILVMSLIGEPAPQLKDSPPKQPQQFFGSVVENIRRFYKAGYVHGDLSAFNILNDREQPCFIDFSQAMPAKLYQAAGMLQRDVKNVAAHFRKLGMKVDEESVVRTITAEAESSQQL